MCEVYEACYGLDGREMSDAVFLDELDVIQHDLRMVSRQEPQATARAEREEDEEPNAQMCERKRAGETAYILAAECATQLIQRVQEED